MSFKACGLHGFQLCGVASDITAVADVHAPNVAVLSAVAGYPAAVWVHDVPVISAVGLLLSTLIFFHLVVNGFSSTALYFARISRQIGQTRT
jgi:hypothetical protein